MAQSDILRIGGTSQGARPVLLMHADRVSVAWIKSFGAISSPPQGILAVKDSTDGFKTERRIYHDLRGEIRLASLPNGYVLMADRAVGDVIRLRRLTSDLLISIDERRLPGRADFIGLRKMNADRLILTMVVAGAPYFMDLFFNAEFETQRVKLFFDTADVKSCDFVFHNGKMAFLIDPLFSPPTESSRSLVELRFSPERYGLWVGSDGEGSQIRVRNNTVWNAAADDVGIVAELGKRNTGDTLYLGVVDTRNNAVDGNVGIAYRRTSG